tara:strand:+ start:77 stop:616 length:540 start_codon:yes stop_codon:yes gene_type:complete
MIKTYTVNTTPFLSILKKSGILDKSSVFPPTSKYRIIITPDPKETIQAAQYTVKNMLLNYTEDTNSQTKWPSRFQWTRIGLGDIDSDTSSGLKEFPIFYKVVFEDSTNPDNDTTWSISDFGEDNSVYAWFYLGKNEKISINSLSETSTDVNIEYNSTLITENEIIKQDLVTKNLTSFNF